MINITLENNKEFYTDYKICLEYLRSINMNNFEYPESVTNFHIYSEIKTQKELMVIKSYLATQNLEKTKLILWSNYDVSDNELLKPYIDHIDMRIYDPIEEAKGTVLENHPYTHANNKYQATCNIMMLSDILRILECYKHGGIWVDTDIIFLRNFKPILDQEFAYMWGTSIDFGKYNLNDDSYGPCATVLSLHKESNFAKLCMDEIANTPIQQNSTCFGEELFAKVYRKYKFTVFPSAFFNTEWQMNKVNGVYNASGLGTHIETQWFDKPLDNNDWVFPEAFSFHWHNTSYKNKQPVPQSKFDILTTLIDNKLKEKKII